MILSNAALNWASVRSGLGLGDFLSSLTPEREQEILKAYNAWRRSKGLPEDKLITSPTASTASTAPLTTPPPEKRKESAIEQLIEQIADEVEKEQEEDAILIGETMEAIDNTPIECVPEEIVEEIATMDEEEAAAEEPVEEPTDPGVDIDGGVDTSAAEEEPAAATTPAAPSVDIDDGQEMPAAENQTSSSEGDMSISEGETFIKEGETLIKEKQTTTESLFDRLSTIARTLPKEQDPALYESLLADLSCSVEEAKATAEDVRKHFTARHRSTVGIRTFMEWLAQ